MKEIYNLQTGEIIKMEHTKEELQEMERESKKIQIQSEIIELKEQLNATDYKIIKASEYNLLGLECEYNIETLHTERQALRDRINELESEVQENDT